MPQHAWLKQCTTLELLSHCLFPLVYTVPWPGQWLYARYRLLLLPSGQIFYCQEKRKHWDQFYQIIRLWESAEMDKKWLNLKHIGLKMLNRMKGVS